MNRRSFLSGLAGLTFSACSSEEPGRDKKLVVWESYNNEEHTVFQEIVDAYRRTVKDGLEVVIQRVPFDGLLSKLITAALARRTPDICRIDVGHIGRLAYGGLAEPLDAYGAEEQLRGLLPIVEKTNRVTVLDRESRKPESHVYGVSDQLTCVALYYNKKLLSTPPKTLEELKAMGPSLKGGGRYAIGLNNSLWWHLPFFYAFGADAVSADNRACLLARPAAKDTLRYLRDLYQQGIEAGAWRAGATNPDQGFVNSKYAMVLSGPWNLKAFKSIDYGVSLIPGTAEVPSATNIGGTSMIVLRNSRHKQAAWDLLRYLVSPPAQRTWCEKTGQLSVHPQVNSERASLFTPEMRVFGEQLGLAHPRPRLPNYDQLENVVNPIFYSILDGTLDVDEGMNKAAALVDQKILAELE